ncbi:ATP-dependent DNA helicase Q-like 4A isoform X2 [Lycium ferocissimum]|uniref:ATP-dependent DNA helicase Q-like 4A isoform X2 n=1 Tax=Lycium ferocissimum TaxID=112874 RepID=UPI0028166015|nr:ATP-dependent DNA helicase Q-like 4A isoform X2 [Lycium ferocissimum]
MAVNSTGGSMSKDKLPKGNLTQHVTALDNFSCQDKFLSSNFLFSLPTQRPCVREEMNARSMACQIRSVTKLEAEKAWKLLTSLKLSPKSYTRPGKTLQLTKDTNTFSQHSHHTQALRSSDGNCASARRRPVHQGVGENSENSDSTTYAGNCFPSHSSGVAETGNVVNRQNGVDTSVANNSHARGVGEISSSHAIGVSKTRESYSAGADGVEEDDILLNIDVDQIVERYQTNCTPQPSVSRFPSITPDTNSKNLAGPEETNLPPELSLNCNHGLKLGLCPGASDHLQEMKDKLINISNDLLDNVSDLSSEQVEMLRQERSQLKLQIQHLERFLQTVSSNEERKMSQCSASTLTSAFQYETPSAFPSRINPVRLDTQFSGYNESSHFDNWNSSSLSFDMTGGYGLSTAPVEREPYIPKYLEVNYIDGSNDKKWSSRDFPWTKKLEVDNKKVFGNHSFRPNQREVINATMSGHDVFVLMPTGGGKSLTYQLPALIYPGITLVISPLVSLIQDQIMHLLQVNIPAAYLSSNMEWTEQQEIFRELNSDGCKYKFLYVTPEKVAKSDVLLRHLESLHTRESLARIVIDEAHCVSQWGHDFRPDYQGLGILKQKFPTVPVLALTATATLSVKEDVVQALGLANCIIFRQSFNRPNLRYTVIPKTKKCLEDIDNFIRTNHFDQCGIIYCLSRMDCERVAEKLQEYGHKAAFYHGSMDGAERANVQKQWSKDEINIICATIAFGMGINKPDVRFVIHHSLPKSIEGYHQECGRAGRDGLSSSCVLYYSYSDYIRVKHMISQGTVEQSPFGSGYGRSNVAASGRILETNVENLLRMVSYCENDVDCRRLLQLIHFGEKFESTNCRKTCDNCCKTQNCIEKDVTEVAKQLVELVKMTGQKFSSAHVLEVYRGSLSQYVKKQRHESLRLHGAGKHLAKGEASRVLRHLVTEDILVEDVKKSDIYGSVSSVLKVNESKVYNLFAGGQAMRLRFPSSVKASKLGKSEATPAKGSLTSGKQSPPRRDPSAVPQSPFDSKLSAKLYTALRKLRINIVKEAGDGVMAYHIFGDITLQQICQKVPRTTNELLDINGIGKVKITKYGDRILETIEATVRDHMKSAKTSGSGNDSTDSGKKRRNSINVQNGNSKDEEYFTESTGRTKKRVLKKQDKHAEDVAYRDLRDLGYFDECLDGDIDFDETMMP